MARTPDKSIGYASDLQTRRQQFACPSARVTAANYCALEMCVEDDFNGGSPAGMGGWGYNDDSNAPLEGPYGFRVDPPPATPSTDRISTTWSFYSLGPRYASYPNPGDQFAVWEADGGGSTDLWHVTHAGPAGNTAVLSPYGVPDVVMNWKGTSYVGPYPGSTYAFRHHNITAVFLFIDGHVETLSAADRIMQADRYCYKLP